MAAGDVEALYWRYCDYGKGSADSAETDPVGVLVGSAEYCLDCVDWGGCELSWCS